MEKENDREEERKGFFTKLFEALDKKLEAKAKKTRSCCAPLKGNKDSDGDSCCG
jgi:hypothetical protein